LRFRYPFRHKILELNLDFFSGITLNSCSSSQFKIEKVASMIEFVEHNMDVLMHKNLDKLRLRMDELQRDLVMYRSKYTIVKIQEIKNLEYRHTVILL
jgi:hypothetical protein